MENEAFEQKCVASDVLLFLRLARIRMHQEGRGSKPDEVLFDWLVDLARRYGNGEQIAKL